MFPAFRQRLFPFIPLVIVLLGFFLSLISLLPIKVDEMGTSDLFIEQLVPIPYWVGLISILCSIFYLLRHTDRKYYIEFIVIASIIFIMSIRMVFAITFTTIPAYEPDASSYINVISSWTSNGINFLTPGYYQHDYPLSFLTGYMFVKFGVPVDTFFRIAPLIIYGVDSLLLYFIIKEVFPGEKRYAAISVFLLALSPLAGWITVHFCPDLFGTIFYLLTLYLSIKFAMKGEWTIKSFTPVAVSAFLLILSHHLSTLFFILTLIGFALSVSFFKFPIKGKPFAFVIIAVFTYTAWFIYGNLVYPEFFDFLSYFSSSGNALVQASNTPILINITFLIYPTFIVLFSLIQLVKTIKITKPRDIVKIKSKLNELKGPNSTLLVVFPLGFIVIIALLFISFALPAIQAPRIIEVIFIGLYPLASATLIKLIEGCSSRKKAVLLLLILVFLTFMAVHRYYNAEQRRVLFA